MEITNSVLPKSIIDAIANIPTNYFDLNEEDLKKEFRFTDKDFLMRKRFATEYENSLVGKQFIVSNVFRGIITNANWYNRVLVNKARLAYIIQPLIEVDDKLSFLEENALHVFEDILVKGEIKGEPASKKNILEAAKIVLSMTRGTKQVQESKKLSLSLTGEDLKNKKSKNLEELDAEIRELLRTTKISINGVSEREERDAEVFATPIQEIIPVAD
jgi:hypothetical protein